MKKIPPEAKKTFHMIVSYLKAGGDPMTPFVTRFCREFEIDHTEFTKVMASPEADTMEAKMRRAGLL